MTVRLYLSGGAANADPELSIGGARSSVLAYLTGTPSALFGSVNTSEFTTGTVLYRLVYAVADTSTPGAKIFIETETPASETTVAIAWGAAGIGGTEPAIATEKTAPPGVTFSAPRTAADAVAIGDMAEGQIAPLWVRYTIDPTPTIVLERFSLSQAESAGVPVNTVAPLVSGTVADGYTLTVTPGTWTGAVSYAYQWQESVDGVSGWANIGTGLQTALAATQIGKYIRCREIASNSYGPGVPVYSNVAGPIAGSSPVNITAPVISAVGPLQPGTTVESTAGDWSGATSYIYAWSISSNGVDGWAAGGTNSTLILSLPNVGKYLKASVSGVNIISASVPVDSNVLGPVVATSSSPSLDFSVSSNSMYIPSR